MLSVTLESRHLVVSITYYWSDLIPTKMAYIFLENFFTFMILYNVHNNHERKVLLSSFHR